MKNRFTEEQIVKVLKEHEGGRPAADIVRELGIAEQTFYSWKRKYGDMNVSEVKRLKQLEAIFSFEFCRHNTILLCHSRAAAFLTARDGYANPFLASG